MAEAQRDFNVLWILGAGASYHLDFPLLDGLPRFFEEVWNDYPWNRNDSVLKAVYLQASEILSAHPTLNIEQLLHPRTSPCSEEERATLRLLIRRTLELRQKGVFRRIDMENSRLARSGVSQLEPYAALLCRMQSGDSILSFNWDNSIEAVMSIALNDYRWLNTKDLREDHRDLFLTKSRNKISDRTLEALQDVKLAYVGSGFSPQSAIEVGNGTRRIELIKPHGSMNWFLGDDERISTGDRRDPWDEPLLSYPEPSKEDLTGGHLEEIRELAMQATRSHDAVIIAGYSFPESDIQDNPLIEEIYAASRDLPCVIVNPAPESSLRLGQLMDSARTLTFQTGFEDFAVGTESAMSVEAAIQKVGEFITE